MSYNSPDKPVYLGSFITRSVNLNSHLKTDVTLTSTIDKDFSTIIYDTFYLGMNFRVNLETHLYLDIATERKVKIKRPDGTSYDVTATGFSDSILYYDFTGTENNQVGVWTFQPLLTFPTSTPISTVTFLLEIKPNL
jgi:hypothetical protein